MAGYEAGTVFVQVVPSFNNAQKLIETKAKEWGRTISQNLKGSISSGISDGIDEGGRTAEPKMRERGNSAGGTFANAFKRRLTAAFQSLPEAKLDADSSKVDRALARIRQQIETLSNKTIGVDIDAAEAERQLKDLQRELADISHKSPNIQVTVDAGRAAAQIQALRTEAERLDGHNVNIDVDADGSRAIAEIGSVRAALLTLGITAGVVAAIPIGAGLIGGLAGIAGAAGAAGAGIGGLAAVAIPAFKHVSDATKAQQAAQEAQALSAAKGASQAGANAAKQVSAANQVANAQLSLQQAQQQAAQQAIQSSQRIADAKRNLARAQQQAVYDQQAALRQVTQAEQQLENAQYSAAAAQRSLNEARQQATRNLQDMGLAAQSAGIAEEQAQLDFQQAGERLRQMEASGTATTEQLKQARLDYMRANINVQRTTIDATRATKDYTTAEAKGVNGSDIVVQARHRLDQANQQVQNSQAQLAQAHQNVARVQQQSSQRIADAQRAVARAQQQAAAQAQQSQAAIVRAQRAVEQAQIAQAQAARQAAQGSDAASTAAAKLGVALGKLTPAERALYDAWQQLRTAFKGWVADLEPSVLPAFVQGINLVKQALPLMTPIVKSAAGAFTQLMREAGAALNSPFWQQFFGYLASTAGPMITSFGHIIGNLAKGFAGLMQAFQPVTNMIMQGLQKLTGAFANFGANAGTNSGFQAFIGYIKRVGPQVVSTLGSIFRAFGHILAALAPLGPPLLAVVRGFMNFITAIPKPVLIGIAVAIGIIAAAVWAMNLAFLANPVVWIIAGIIAAIVAIVATIWWLVSNWTVVWDTIKAVVTIIWNAISAFFVAAFNGFIAFWVNTWNTVSSFFTNIFNGIKNFFVNIWNTVVNWFAQKIAMFKAGWNAEWQAISDFFGRIFNGIKNFFVNIWNTVVQWFKDKIAYFKAVWKAEWDIISGVFTKVWNWIKDTAVNIWNHISGFFSGAFDKFTGFFKGVWNHISDFFGGIWDGMVKTAKKVWDGIKAVVAKPINFVINTILNDGLFKAWNAVAGFLHLDSLKIKPLSPVHFANGGVLPGYSPGVDSIPAMLSPGEAVLTPGAALALGHSNILALNAMHAPGRTGFATGGIAGNPLRSSQDSGGNYHAFLGGIFDWVGSAAKAVWHGVSGFVVKAAEFFKDPVGFGKKMLENAITSFGGDKMLDSTWGKILFGLPKSLIGGLVDKIKEFFSGGGNYGGHGGAAPPGQISDWIAQALMILHKPLSWSGGIFQQVMSESGGRPGIIQQIHDVNSGGNEARGLMQVIPTTFAANMLPGHGNIFNPVDNLIAAIRYAENRYGAGWFNMGPWHAHGYAVGTPWVPEDQLAYIHEGEAVIPRGVNEMLRRQSRSGVSVSAVRMDHQGGLAAGGMSVTTNVYPQQAMPEEVGVSVSRNTAREVRRLV